ncbi:MAG: class I SAM-dependent rRNA methyltransferase [Oscillospiraceae bacterium]|nr:class I SAM-dependent rRNA methyltransferase [Oscillospiraceae bacterium]
MKAERNYPVASVTKKAEASIKKGHPWVYDTEIKNVSGEWTNGCLTDVVSEKGSYLGTGFVSEKSKIRIRLLSTNANDKFDYDFYKRRIRYAVDYRRTVMGEDFSACRLVFGEADSLPGLTVDRYENLLVTQVLSYGMDMIKDVIFKALVEVLNEYSVKIDGIYERNDVAIRELEGLECYKGWYKADFVGIPASPLTEITENGIKYEVDVENGQKTGFFLDQKYNRLAVAKIAKGKRVLDCFTHTGSFALNAAMGGAEHVTAVDVSQTAIDKAKENAEKNGLTDRMDFLCTNVFDLLPELCKGKSPYDMIILDPPAFTKNRKTVSDAERGYKEINYRAMKLLPRGGYLATCSCSHFMDNGLFVKMLMSAASDAGVSLKLIEARRQSPDHPTLLNVPETDYLKFYLFQII